MLMGLCSSVNGLEHCMHASATYVMVLVGLMF